VSCILLQIWSYLVSKTPLSARKYRGQAVYETVVTGILDLGVGFEISYFWLRSDRPETNIGNT